MNAFLETDDWQLVTAAYFLELPQTQGQSLMALSNNEARVIKHNLSFPKQKSHNFAQWVTRMNKLSNIGRCKRA